MEENRANAEIYKPPPFEDAEKSFIDGLFETLKLSALEPAEFFGRLRPTGDIARPLFFAVIVLFTASVFGTLAMLGVENMLGFQHDVFGGKFDLALKGAAPFLTIIITPVAILAMSAVYHLLFMALGVQRYPFDVTVKLFSYAHAPRILSVFPIVGDFAGFVWSATIMAIGVREVCGIKNGKAILILLAPIVLAAAVFAAIAVFGTFVFLAGWQGGWQ